MRAVHVGNLANEGKSMRNRNLLMCIVVAVTVGACGGEATDDAPAGTTETTAQAGAATSTTAVSTTSATVASGNGSEEGGVASAACIDATQAMAAAMSSYSTGMMGVMSGNFDSESLELAAGQMEAMAGAAPEEIRDEMMVIATELGKFYEALAEIDYEAGAVPTPEQSEQLAALGDSIDQQAFDEAALAVELWFEENC